MNRSLPLAILLAACAATPTELRREPAADAAARELQAKKEDERRRDFRAVLVRLDQAIDSYVQALANQGEFRADKQAERIYKLVHETVMDIGPYLATTNQVRPKPGETYARLQGIAGDNSNRDQGIALTALGFSGQPEAMPVILQGAQLADPFLVDHAVLGLAVLRAPTTPPGVLAAIALKPDHPMDGRVQAAWALYRIQGACEDQSAIVAIWRRFLGEQKDQVPPGVLVSALRGLGIARDPANGALVAGFLMNPTPRVRMAAALALGRMNAQAQWPQLLALLSPAETVQNVRLHARKALAELAGGVDHGYDVAAWRSTFDRGSR
ncbi:MAG: HEAT repeat domain-containing protein [Planctomycetota bacterium]